MKRILKYSITAITLLFALWFLAPMAYRIINIGNIFGLMLCAIILFRITLSRYYHKFKNKMLQRRLTNVCMRLSQIICWMLALYCVCISVLMVGAMIPAADEQGTAIVLGAQVKPWGPSALLQQRIDAAEDYLLRNSEAAAVLSGGQGADEVKSEAQCMYDVMSADGIDPYRLYIEEQSTNTYQNIHNAIRIIDEQHLDRQVVIVTDSYHQLRAKIIAKKSDSTLKISPINTKNNITGISTYPTYFVREWIAIPVEIIK